MPWVANGAGLVKPPKLKTRPAVPEVGELPVVIDGWFEMEARSMAGGTLDLRGANQVEFVGCELFGVQLLVDPDADLRFRRCGIQQMDLSAIRVESLIESRLEDCKFGGTDISESTVRDVHLIRCFLRSTDFFSARLERVKFEDCQLAEVRFVHASLSDVSVPGSTLTTVDVARATIERFDLRDAAGLDFDFLPNMKGAVITDGQALELALLTAHSIGFSIERPAPDQ